MWQVSNWMWIAFAVVLGVLLAVDLFVHRGGRATSRRSATLWTVIWIGVGLAFGGFVALTLGPQAAEEYLAAYLIEKSLSLDNLFVFLVIFRSLAIPQESQHTALAWGILGALAFRALFIFLGVAAIERYEWVTYVFAGILLWAAYRSLREDPSKRGESRVALWLSRHLPVTPQSHGARFLARQDGRLLATPLLLAVFAVELTDIVFAIDSVPAALAVTRSRFVVYTSNAFAILGLRALYLVLEGSLSKLAYLHYGLAAVLAFAGLKMLLAPWLHVPPLISVAIIVVCIAAAVWASLRARRRGRVESVHGREPGVQRLPHPGDRAAGPPRTA
jgi:tellurite resistance protein TerC